MASSTGEVRECEKCGATGNKPGVILQLCGACKSVRYCSTECQTADWKTHKPACKLMQQMQEMELKEQQAGPASSAATSSKRVLMVSGFGMDFGVDPVLGALQRAGFKVDNIMWGEGERAVIAKLASGDYRVCVVVGLGSGSSFKPKKPCHPFPESGPLRDQFLNFVRSGGLLMVQGERPAAYVLSKWFNKTWAMEGGYYARTQHNLNSGCAALAGADRNGLLPACNVKACMLSGVPPEERLYSAAPNAATQSMVFAPTPVEADKCALVAAREGQGTVVFWGDVNFEPDTLHILVKLAQKLPAPAPTPAAA